MSELKACPACNKNNNIGTEKMSDGRYVRFRCFTCGYARDEWLDTETDALKSWQSRPIEDKYRNALEDICTAFFVEGGDKTTAYNMYEIAEKALK